MFTPRRQVSLVLRLEAFIRNDAMKGMVASNGAYTRMFPRRARPAAPSFMLREHQPLDALERISCRMLHGFEHWTGLIDISKKYTK